MWILFSDEAPPDNVEIVFSDDNDVEHTGYITNNEIWESLDGPDEIFNGVAIKWRLP